MAYAFKKIEELAANEGQEGDIFANAPEQQPQDAGSSAGGMAPKTSTAGDLGATGNVTGGMSQPKQPSAPKERQRAIQQNIGKTKAPTNALSNITSDLRKRRGQIESAADRYKTEQQNRFSNQYNLGDKTLDKAISGDTTALGRAQDVLGKTQASQAPQFELPDYDKNEDLKLLDNEAGLQELASRGQGPRYNQGMAAFDTMLMKQDPNFSRLINQVRGEGESLQEVAGALPEQTQAAVQDFGNEALTSAQSQAEKYLRNYQSGLLSQQEKEAADYQKYLDELDQAAITNRAYDDVIGEVGGDLTDQYGDRIVDYIKGASVNPMDYIDFDRGGYLPTDFIDAEEAVELGNIASLLGEEAQYTPGSIGPAYTIDYDSLYNELIGEISGAIQAGDVAGAAEIQKILDAAQARADADDARRLGLVESYDQDLSALADTVLAEDPTLGQWFDDSMLAGYTRPGEQVDLGAADVLSSGDVARLNELAADIGTGETYGVGDYASNPMSGLIDEADFKKYLLAELAKRKEFVQGQSIGQQIDQFGNVIDTRPTMAETVPGRRVIAPIGNDAIVPVDPRGVNVKPKIQADEIANPYTTAGTLNFGQPTSGMGAGGTIQSTGDQFQDQAIAELFKNTLLSGVGLGF